MPNDRMTNGAAVRPSDFIRHWSFVLPRPFPLDAPSVWWETSHMQTTLVKADDKGRVSIRGTRKGQQYLVTAEKGGWWVTPAPKVQTPVRDLDKVVADSWDKLGPAPDIDYDKI